MSKHDGVLLEVRGVLETSINGVEWLIKHSQACCASPADDEQLMELKQALARLDALIADVPEGIDEANKWDDGYCDVGMGAGRQSEFKIKYGGNPNMVRHNAAKLLQQATMDRKDG